MRILLLLSFITVNALLYGQDTTFIEQRPYSGKLVRVTNSKDTTLVGFYKNGALEATREYKNKQISGKYDRWYENGKQMWEKHLLNNLENGNCIYYNDEGVKVAEFSYDKGIIKDTVFLDKRETLLFGRATHYEVIHGGVYRPEPTLDKAPRQWPFMNYPFILCRIRNAKSIPETFGSFETDACGMFFLCLPVGEYGFFPGNYEMKILQPGQYCPPPHNSNGMTSGWNMLAPLKIENSSPVFFHLHYSSEGYAP